MTNLSAPYWNALVVEVAERLSQTMEQLLGALEASGYPPFTVEPEPAIRWLIYTMRPLEEWKLAAQGDPERALDEVRDFSNMARRRGEPEAARMALETVLAQLVVEGSEVV